MREGECNLPPWGPDQLFDLRSRLAQGAGEAPWDVVVVGAGITGAGVARDAALRGLRVLVLEAQDVAFGTSSRSSRLIHGGVRYLEQGELGLVYEALRERSLLYQTARHLVRPARFLFPTYRGDRLGPWKLRLGLSLYDLLALRRAQTHEFLHPAATLETEPLLASDDLRGAVRYEDAVTDDARLTLAVLQDARRHGAEVLTRAAVDGIEAHDDGHRITLGDGSVVRARRTVVATGPWTGSRLLGRAGAGLLALSKGIHIVMRSADVPVRQPVVVQSRTQRRILFVVPWGMRTYLGTTDSAYAGDPGASGVTTADEDELLELVGRVLPSAPLDRDHIVSAWSGVRPLVRGAGAASGDTVELSRTHRVVENDAGVLGIVGGKLTTYRAMAEDVVDRAVRGVPEPARAGPCRTRELPVVPGAPLSDDELADPLLGDLAPRHGPNARALAARVAAQPELGERLVADLPYRWVEVEHCLAYEACTHLDDILRRRLPLALTDVDLGARVAPRIARMLVDARGGSDRDVREELERYCDVTERETRRRPNVTG